MKIIKSLLPVFLLIFIFSCEKTTGNQNGISGRVYYLDRSGPVNNAKVFFGMNDFFPSCPNFQQFNFTNSNGFYFFNKPENPGNGNIYAKKEISDRYDAYFISPIIDFTIYQEDEQINVDDIYLYEVHNNSQISGIVNTDNGQILPNCFVELFRLEDMNYTKIDSTFSNTNGIYQFSNVKTGNYQISSSAVYDDQSIWYNRYFFISGNENLDLTLFLTNINEDKPVIYIYTEFDQLFQINLNLNNGTKLTKSIPEYNSGWDVFVEESGLIDHKFEYLFYETSIIEFPRFFSGWCFKQEEMKKGLLDVLHKIGLNEKETTEFLEYWLPRFDKYDYYKVYYLLNEQLDYYVGLDIYPLPDSELRTLFFFEGCENYENLPEPIILDFIRVGTTVVEWGGVLMN